jgi:hypothetical protein
MRASMRVMVAIVLMTVGLVSRAGQVQAQSGRGGEAPPIPLKVTVTISRFEGEKKTANLPFVLWVNTGDQASIQMGSDTPIPQTTFATKEGGASTPVTSYSYRPLGTNISCSASVVGEGLYRLVLSVSDSQVFRQNANSIGPVFQNFQSKNSPILRDGQTVQFSVATDKTTGEVIKLDVTLNLVK